MNPQIDFTDPIFVRGLTESLVQEGYTEDQINTALGGRIKQQNVMKAAQSGIITPSEALTATNYQVDITGLPNNISNEQKSKIKTDLRSEYFTRTKENDFIDVTNNYGKVKTAPDTPAGDVSMIFAYMKLIDPASVVREGEFATAQNTAGVPQQIVNAYNRALKGKRLGDKQRVDFIDSSSALYNQYKSSQKQIDDFYINLAKQEGINPEDLGIGTIGYKEATKEPTGLNLEDIGTVLGTAPQQSVTTPSSRIISETPIDFGEVISGVGTRGYELAVKPVVEGIKGGAETLGVLAYSIYRTLQNNTDEKMGTNTWTSIDEFFEPIVNEKYSDASSAIVNSSINGLATAGAVYDIATLGAGGTSTRALLKGGAKVATQNLAINAPIFGTGNVLNTLRTKENVTIDDLKFAFLDGALGRTFVGPWSGAFGPSPETAGADLVTSLIVPILGAKAYDSLGKKIGSTKSTMSVDEIADSLKKGAGESVTPKLGETAEPMTAVQKAQMKVGKKAKNILKGEAGKTAGTLLVPDKKSISNSEKLAQQYIKMTESNTVYGMAKEMPEIVNTSGNYIDDAVKNWDKSHAALDAMDIQNQIRNQLIKTSEGMANPANVDKVVDEISNQFGNGQYATLTQTNNARKYLNKSISRNWFSQGMPVDTNTNEINSLKFTASQILKDLIIDTPDAAKIGDAVELQHLALSAEPLLSNKFFKDVGTQSGFPTSFKSFILNSLKSLDVFSLVERGKISAVRRLTDVGVPNLDLGTTGKVLGASDTNAVNPIKQILQDESGSANWGAEIGRSTAKSKGLTTKEIINNRLKVLSGKEQAFINQGRYPPTNMRDKKVWDNLMKSRLKLLNGKLS